MGPLIILACVLLILGYSLVYTGASIGTTWQTTFRSALLGGLKGFGAAA